MSVTPAGLPRAGAKSKLHHYKRKLQKTKELTKHGLLTGKNLKISDGKKHFQPKPNNLMEHMAPKYDNWTVGTLQNEN